MTRRDDQHGAARPGSKGAGFDWAFLNGILLASVLYTLSFNVLDDATRTALAGVVGLLMIARCLLSWPRHPASVASTFLLLGFLVIPVFYFIFTMDPRQQDGAAYATLLVRMGTCVAVLLVFTHTARVASPRLLTISTLAIIVAAAVVAATGPYTYYAGTTRPATFTGGAEGVHSAGYVLAAFLLGVITLWRCSWLSLGQTLGLGLPLLALVLLFQVRTTWFMLVAYGLVAAVIELMERDRRATWIAPALFIAAAGLLTFVTLLDSDHSEFSSGRTDAYAERLEMIAARPLPQLLLGTGAGSEMITNSVWWWEAKNSHNDFIDIAIQNGLVGLSLLIAMLAIIAVKLDRFQLPLFAAFVSSSLISNGLLGRPFIAALLLAFVLLPIRRVEAIENPAHDVIHMHGGPG